MEGWDVEFSSLRAAMKHPVAGEHIAEQWGRFSEAILWRRQNREQEALQVEREAWDGTWTADLSQAEYQTRLMLYGPKKR
jgi:hypothetical protein